MVEYGIIKKFNDDKLSLGGQWGFITICDEAGRPTDKDIFFHRNDLATLRLNFADGVIKFSTKLADWQRSRYPQVNDQVVFERGTRSGAKPRVRCWTFRENWLADLRELSGQRQVEWRIVLRGYETTGHRRISGIADETGRQETISITVPRVRDGSFRDARSWTALELGFFTDDLDDNDRQGYDEYRYYLQVRYEGKWVTIKPIEPIDWSDDYDPKLDPSDPDYPYWASLFRLPGWEGRFTTGPDPKTE